MSSESILPGTPSLLAVPGSGRKEDAIPSQAYAFEENGPKRLEVSWIGLWRDVTLRLDGVTIGTVPARLLSAGQEFSLPDGSTLKVQWAMKLTQYAPRVLRDGQPLPGSPSSPESRLRLAYGVVLTIAGFNIVFGLAAWASQAESFESAGISLSAAIFGVSFLVLGYFAWRRSLVALLIAIAVFALDSLALLFGTNVPQGYRLGATRWPNPVWAIPRIALLWPMIRGIGAIWAIRRRKLTSKSSKIRVLPVERASLRQRSLAHAIDLGMLGIAEGCWVVAGGLVLWLFGTEQARRWPAVLWGIVAAAIPAIYLTWAHATSGQTLGKRILALKVVSIDGSPLTWGKGILRTVGYVISNLPLGLGLLSSIWDTNRQAGHDKIAGTVVVPAFVQREQLQGAIERSEVRRRQRQWLLDLAIPALSIAAGFLLWMQLCIVEVRGMRPWPGPQVPPQRLAKLDLSRLGLGVGHVENARDEGTWAEGLYEDGVVVRYRRGADTVLTVWALRYETVQAARDDYSSVQAWAEGSCGLSTTAHVGSAGVIHCQFSDAYEKIFWNRRWILDILALEGSGLAPDVLVNHVRDAIAAHWRAMP